MIDIKYKIIDAKDELIYFLKNIMRKYYSFKCGVSNLLLYRKIIWNDRWYDHGYLIDIIVFKLETMITNWDKSHYDGSDFTKKRMIIIKNRIKTFCDDYDEIVYLYFSKKISEDEFKERSNELTKKVFYVFGKNLQRFWD